MTNVSVRNVLWVFAAVLLVSACDSDLRGRIEAARVFSPRRVEVGNNAVVNLGQLLFFDRELSGNRNIACASCHFPFKHAGDGEHLGVGEDLEPLPRNTIEPFNRSFATAMLWDGRIERLEDGSIRSPVPLPEGVETLLEAQALLPLLDRHEMRGQPGDIAVGGQPNELAALADDDPQAIWDAVLARILAIEEYRAHFAAAFPRVPLEEITIVHVARAMAQFEMRLWELTDTAFDDFLGSVSNPPQDAAMDPRSVEGASLFFGDAGCFRCHNGPLLSDERYHNIGVPQLGPRLAEEGLDEGRFRVTGDPRDRFAFRTPSLRNVSLTGPYMHDGAYTHLFDVIAHHLDPERQLRQYTGVQLPEHLRTTLQNDPATQAQILATLSDEVRPLRPLTHYEIESLVAFLFSLASRTELTVFPEAGVPFAVPSGLPIDSPFEPRTR